MNIGKWLERFSIDLNLKYGSEKTRECYYSQAKKFLHRHSQFEHPKEIPNDEIKKWIVEAEKFNSRNHRLCAVNAFYRLTVGMPLKTGKIPFPKKDKKLPRIIDNEILKAQILSIPNLKHKAILAVAYCCALRVSEVCNLKISDIDDKQKLVLIRRSKGNKDRYVGISENTLNIVSEYLEEYTPKEYLFEGQNGGRYTHSSCNAIYHKYIDTETSFHNLRHSSITSMIESGANILPIGAAVGHSNPRTTAIYYHCSKKFLSSIPAPL